MSKVPHLVLVINSGSSSLKFSVLPSEGNKPLLYGVAECLNKSDARFVRVCRGQKRSTALRDYTHEAALAALFEVLRLERLLDDVAVVGHRVVHGGEHFKESVVITKDVLRDIEALSGLAPLHNPANVLGIRTCLTHLPHIPQVAVFDTAFHQTMPRAAWAYAIPQRFYRAHGVRRYGFHGMSHQYVAHTAIHLLDLDSNDCGLVIAHLGNGASATAVLNGQSVDTSMGMTPLEGLVMGTRSGDVDFGAMAYLSQREKLGVEELANMLNHQSGLLGLSELSNDCRALEEAASHGHDGAMFALEAFVHRLAKYIGALATSLPRLDAVIFTGGIGENSALVRAMTLKRLTVLGLSVNAEANQHTVGGRAGRIDGGMRHQPSAWVIPTDEERLIAEDAMQRAHVMACPTPTLLAH